MSTTNIKTTVEEMIQPYLNEQGFELVDIEYVKEGSNWFYGCMSTKGGIDIDDCVLISES